MADRECRLCGCTDAWIWADVDLCAACEEYMLAPVLADVGAERRRQDLRWGGPDIDDRKSQQEWLGIADRLLVDAFAAGRAGDEAGYRKAMIQVAAVSVAAVEAHDRKTGR